MNIALIGFMGTGKTVVGRLLARRLKRRFVDIDALIEQREGRSIARIFAESGEPYFRRMERAMIADVVKQAHIVVGTGGGAVLNPANLRALKQSGPVICLEASVSTILARVSRTHYRPLLSGGDPRRRIMELLRQRQPAYAHADWTVDTSRQPVRDVVRVIEAYVASRLHRKHGAKSYDLPASLCRHIKDLGQRYAGCYVAIVDDHVVAVGRSRREVYAQASEHVSSVTSIGLVYVPQRNELVNVSP